MIKGQELTNKCSLVPSLEWTILRGFDTLLRGGWCHLGPWSRNLDDVFILAFSLPCSKTPPAQQTAYTESFSGSAFGEQGLLLLDTPTVLHGENGVDTPNLYFFCEFSKSAPTKRDPW